MKRSEAYCILGGGPSGLVAARNFLAAGIPVEILERQEDFGGNWFFGSPHSSVFASTHLISSKRMTQFQGFPMPKSFPPYPSHSQALSYLRDFAKHFELYSHARFKTSVNRVQQHPEGWLVYSGQEEPTLYPGLVVATGHHWNPLLPSLPGNFSGELLHAHDYKTPEPLTDKRVLIVGGGNSGCDIAVDASRVASQTFLSWRRGYHILPKFLWGGPLDSGGEWYHRWHFPMWLRRLLTRAMVYVAQGSPQRYGLPRPTHALFESHPIVNSQLLYQIGHGKLRPRPGIKQIEGDLVHFDDGTSEVINIIICATGYQVSFPFLNEALQPTSSLFLNAFHPQHDTLFFAGLLQPNGSIWPLVDEQTQLMAAYVKASRQQLPIAQSFQKQIAKPWSGANGGLKYVASPRHQYEVEFFDYRDQVRRYLRQFPATPVVKPSSEKSP